MSTSNDQSKNSKTAKNVEIDKEKEALLLAIGLEPKFVQQTLKNPKITKSLLEVLDASKVASCDKKIGALLYSLASTIPESLLIYRDFLAVYIAEGKITTQTQLTFAFTFLKKEASAGHAVSDINKQDFEKECGVGVVITVDQMQQEVLNLFTSRKEDLNKLRYTINLGEYLSKLRERLPFADGAVLNKIFNEELVKFLGPLTEEDQKMKEKAKKKPEKEKAEKAQAPKEEEKKEVEEEADSDKLKKLMARDLGLSLNSERVLKEHVETVGNKVYTRFPPEPNGYLHIGHAKAMRFNFNTAREVGGHCYLRFDDTNPDKENEEYILNIKKNVQWLGYTPYKITHASDNFGKLYEFAVQLIKKNKAFVCQQTKAEMNEYRKLGQPSPYRDRPIEESLKMFENMRRGLYEEGKVSLRLKIDPAHVNPTMRDPVAYRIKYTPHPHAKDKWCIYPMYDYTHGICDSLEHITHSLCTLEFEIRRDLYYWVLDQLEIYKPFVWEYSRLNISNTVLSKRKLHRLVFENKVQGWDDPRILTLNGLRRRGYTSEAINEFCDHIGVTRRGNENIISYTLLEHFIRKDLDNKARRTMAVLDPVKLTLVNIEENYAEKINAPDFPKDPSKGTHEIHLTKEIYVERQDIKLEDQADFFGIAPKKIVGLKYAHVIRILSVDINDKGEIIGVSAEMLKDSKEKPKSFLHWISSKESIDCETRLYEVLFTAHDPNELEDYLTAFNHNSKIVFNSKINKNLLGR